MSALNKVDKETELARVEREEKVENKVKRRSGAAHNIDNAADQVKAGTKAMGKKVTDPNRPWHRI